MNLGKVSITLIGIALSVLLGWAFIAFMTKEKPAIDHVSKLASTGNIKVQTVKNNTVAVTIKSEGRVHNASTVHLISEVKGEIVKGKHPLKQGTSFRKGELIFSVSNPEGKFALKAARSAFIQLLTGLLPDLKVDFKKDYKRWEEYYAILHENNNLPEIPEIDDERERMFLSNRQLFKTYYEVKAREAQFQKHYFYAPFDGVLMYVLVQEGTQLNPGMNVGMFGKTSEKEIEVSLSKVQAEQVKKGDKVVVTKINSSLKLEGKVDRVSDFLNPATQSFSCFVKLEDKSTAIKDGEYYTVSINAGEITKAQELSIEAIYGESEVYMLQPDSTLQKQSVELAYTDDEKAIVKGLNDGSKVLNQKIEVVSGRKYKALN